jgi:hypothetical protein
LACVGVSVSGCVWRGVCTQLLGEQAVWCREGASSAYQDRGLCGEFDKRPDEIVEHNDGRKPAEQIVPNERDGSFELLDCIPLHRHTRLC